MAVDDDRVPAEGLPSAGELVHVVFPHRVAALAERVDVGDGADAVQPVEHGGIGRLPDRPLGALAVAHQDVGARVRSDATRIERDADGRAQALAERAGRHVDKRQPRRRMALEGRADGSELEQLVATEGAGLGPRRIEQRRGVPLRQHEAIGVRGAGVLRIEPELAEEQRRDDFGGGHARGRMATAGLGGGSDRVDAKAMGDVLEGRERDSRVSGHHDLEWAGRPGPPTSNGSSVYHAGESTIMSGCACSATSRSWRSQSGSADW